MTDKHSFTDDMREISGFGGSYEQCCRDMLLAGMTWLDEHPDADPRFMEYRNVFGVAEDDNEDARQLTEAVIAAANGQATGAMHHAVISHLIFIKKNGWDAYVKEMSD